MGCSLAILFLKIFFAMSGQWAMVSVGAPQNFVGSLGGVMNFGGYLGGTLAPIITGWLIDYTHSFHIALMICSLATSLGALSYWFIVKDRIDGGMPAAPSGA